MASEPQAERGCQPTGGVRDKLRRYRAAGNKRTRGVGDKTRRHVVAGSK